MAEDNGFTDAQKEEAKKRADYKCECERKTCGHAGRCNSKKDLEVHHIKALKDGGKSIPSNAEVLCYECHKNTRSYGKH
ncbi:MAG: HNH endonuclease [Spirochaetaceae bacterium]|nr:HNH endonuclease [Spirochaetaceae bacterium]